LLLNYLWLWLLELWLRLLLLLLLNLNRVIVQIVSWFFMSPILDLRICQVKEFSEFFLTFLINLFNRLLSHYLKTIFLERFNAETLPCVLNKGWHFSLLGRSTHTLKPSKACVKIRRSEAHTRTTHAHTSHASHAWSTHHVSSKLASWEATHSHAGHLISHELGLWIAHHHRIHTCLISSGSHHICSELARSNSRILIHYCHVLHTLHYSVKFINWI
jgi:hypothetical protein